MYNSCNLSSLRFNRQYYKAILFILSIKSHQFLKLGSSSYPSFFLNISKQIQVKTTASDEKLYEKMLPFQQDPPHFYIIITFFLSHFSSSCIKKPSTHLCVISYKQPLLLLTIMHIPLLQFPVFSIKCNTTFYFKAQNYFCIPGG